MPGSVSNNGQNYSDLYLQQQNGANGVSGNSSNTGATSGSSGSFNNSVWTQSDSNNGVVDNQENSSATPDKNQFLNTIVESGLSVALKLLTSYAMGEETQAAKKANEKGNEFNNKATQIIKDADSKIENTSNIAQDFVNTAIDAVEDMGTENTELEGVIDQKNQENEALITENEQILSQLEQMGVTVDAAEFLPSDGNVLQSTGEESTNTPIGDMDLASIQNDKDALIDKLNANKAMLDENTATIAESYLAYITNIQSISDLISSSQTAINTAQQAITATQAQAETNVNTATTNLTTEATSELTTGVINEGTSDLAMVGAETLDATSTATSAIPVVGGIASSAAETKANQLREISKDSGTASGAAKENFMNEAVMNQFANILTQTINAAATGNWQNLSSSLNTAFETFLTSSVQYTVDKYSGQATDANKPQTTAASDNNNNPPTQKPKDDNA